MLFTPPCCPSATCSSRASPTYRFQRRGTFTRQCDGRSVPRFTCSHCGKSFSTQTYRTDYRLKLPHLHLTLFRLFVSKVTLRQAARITGTRRKTVEHRLELLGEHCRAFQTRMLAPMRGKLRGSYLLDELETFERDRRLGPLTVPVQIERKSFFVLDMRVATLPARGRLSPALEAKKRCLELLHGRRKSGSNGAVRACFERLAELHDPEMKVQVLTDRKQSYASLLERVFGARLVHVRHPGKAPRDTHNPLFPINLSLALLRDGLSRLVRRTWAHAKRASRLEQHLWIWGCWRNYVRWRTNKTRERTPAMELGVTHRCWQPSELLRWNPRLVA